MSFLFKNFLAVCSDNLRCRLEITINHPRTVPFLRASTDEQKEIYYKIYKSHRDTMMDYIIEDVYRYEITESENKEIVHMHIYMDMCIPFAFSVEGLVMDCVRNLIFSMPKRTHYWLSHCHYSDLYQVFRSPPVCVQFTRHEEIKRIEHWASYIDKDLISKPNV